MLHVDMVKIMTTTPGRASVTLADVAALAKVSTSTASLAYRRTGSITERTRARILAAGAEIGYAGPNPTARSLKSGRSGIVGIIVLLTVALSAPLGGMLWHWHDMQAGYFPAHWQRILLAEGSRDGLVVGWLVVLLSVPYNVLGIIICYFLTRTGARLFRGSPNR
jgi:hypothetical protein